MDMFNRCTYTIFFAAVAVLFLQGIAGCSSDNPTGPGTSTPDARTLDTSNRMVVLRDSSITESSWSLFFFHLSWADTVTRTMSFDATIGNKHAGSIYSMANSTAQALSFSEIGNDPEFDSIVGVEFQLLARESAKTNFVAFLSKETGSRSSAYHLGIGFDKSDSIKILWSTTDVAAQVDKNIAPIQFGKWYTCTIEYNTANQTATYYIDKKAIGTNIMPSTSTSGYNMFVVYRDASGRDGTAPYYFNDVTFYKIQKRSYF
jgi:hypothetical protein